LVGGSIAISNNVLMPSASFATGACSGTAK
jgi:hypothetical protein